VQAVRETVDSNEATQFQLIRPLLDDIYNEPPSLCGSPNTDRWAKRAYDNDSAFIKFKRLPNKVFKAAAIFPVAYSLA
jgi:hypothetical protein